MIEILRGRGKESASDQAQSQEVDELHLLSEQLYHRRVSEDWSQECLAEVAGMTQAQIALIEAGRANPTVRTLVKVANALNCRVGDLFQSVKYESLNHIPAARWTKESIEPLSYELTLRFADERDPHTEIDFSPSRSEVCTTRTALTSWWTAGPPANVVSSASDRDVRLITVRPW